MEKVHGVLVRTLLEMWYFLIFGADNNLSSYTDNQKNTFLVLGERSTGINDINAIHNITGAAEILYYKGRWWKLLVCK